MLVNTRIIIEIGQGKFEQRGGRLCVIPLQMNKCTGQLDQPLVKRAVRAVPVAEPQMLQYFMGFVKKLLVETMEIAEIMWVQCLPVMMGGHFGDAFALAAHGLKVEFDVQSLKPKVVQIIRSPASCPAPREKEQLQSAFGFMDDHPAISVAGLFSRATNDSPSPGGDC